MCMGVLEDVIRNMILVNSVLTYIQVCRVSDAVKDIQYQMKLKSLKT